MYLELLLCEISRTSEAKEDYDSVVEDMKIYIRKNIERFIKAEELAEKYHFSVRTISAKFKENTGESLHAWQMKMKCQMAEELMQYDATLTLKELANTYGFYDEYHFGKCYKKIMGYSPKKGK